MAALDTIEGRVAAAVSEIDADGVLSWRFGELARAGYRPDDAVLLARAPEVDLHVAVDLVLRGCEPALALRILL